MPVIESIREKRKPLTSHHPHYACARQWNGSQPATKVLWILIHTNFPQTGVEGIYNPRNIVGTNILSLHAEECAQDIGLDVRQPAENQRTDTSHADAGSHWIEQDHVRISGSDFRSCDRGPVFFRVHTPCVMIARRLWAPIQPRKAAARAPRDQDSTAWPPSQRRSAKSPSLTDELRAWVSTTGASSSGVL
jgi:hypothetical protein